MDSFAHYLAYVCVKAKVQEGAYIDFYEQLLLIDRDPYDMSL